MQFEGKENALQDALGEVARLQHAKTMLQRTMLEQLSDTRRELREEQVSACLMLLALVCLSLR